MSEPHALAETTRPWIKPLFILLLVALFMHDLHLIWPLLVAILKIVAPFAIGLLVAYVFHPIVSFVQVKLRLGRAAGIAVLSLSILLVLAGVIVWIAPVLYDQITSGTTALSQSAENLVVKIQAKYPGIDVLQALKEQPQKLAGQTAGGGKALDAIQPVSQGALTIVKTVAGGVFTSVQAVGGFLAGAVFVVVIAFYFLADMHDIPPVMRKLLPERHRDHVWTILERANRDVGGFLRGQLIACLIVGVLTMLLLIGVGLREYALLIGIFAGLMHFIPYLGPIAGATPAVLWVLLTQSLHSWGERGIYVLIVLGGFTLIETIDGLVTQPFIVGKRASLHPLTMILALAIGAQAGIGGMIIAVPMACIARVLWLELFWQYRSAGEDVPVKKKWRPWTLGRQSGEKQGGGNQADV